MGSYSELKNDDQLIVSSYSWDQYFMTMAYLVAMRSKDPSSKIGAVIVGEDFEVRATGYNGFPRAIEDKCHRYENKEYKYLAINHAEENAILQCARIGVASKNCTLYVPWIPCAGCSKLIIQAGIIKVVYDSNFPGNCPSLQANWQNSINISLEMLNESGVKVCSFSNKLIKLEGLYKQVKFDPLLLG